MRGNFPVCGLLDCECNTNKGCMITASATNKTVWLVRSPAWSVTTARFCDCAAYIECNAHNLNLMIIIYSRSVSLILMFYFMVCCLWLLLFIYPYPEDLANRDKHWASDCVTTALNKEGDKDITGADIKTKCLLMNSSHHYLIHYSYKGHPGLMSVPNCNILHNQQENHYQKLCW